MLNALSVSLQGANQDGLLRAAACMERQGFRPAVQLDWNGGQVRGWSHPGQQGVPDCRVCTADANAVCVGPLWYRGRFGTNALALLLDEIGADRPVDEFALRGNFALFLRAGRRCLLLNDALGLVRIHASADGFFHGTSWLAMCAYAGGAELDEVAAAEYVLLGAPHSDRTVARGITKLPLGQGLDLERRQAFARFPAHMDAGVRVRGSLDDAVEEISTYLQTAFKEVATAFPGRVRTALSGGFDSRLIVAGLLACGARPKLFVYGDAASEDIPIARAVADAAGLPLDVIDKGALDRGLAPAGIERLVNSALFFDGLPADGILDRGVDRTTRLQQTEDGHIALNGGGGEIFRNFFHLPDRPFRAAAVVRAFYRGFDAAVFRRADGLAGYRDSLVASMGQVLGVGPNAGAHRRLTREQIELLYPLFRCHHWMGVNNSIAVRHGHYSTPLVDLNTVRLACRLPMAWKNAGTLESRLIARLDRTIADQPSAYGFRFGAGPDRHARFSEWATCMRPVVARPFINAARRRLHGTRVAPDMLAHYRKLLPGEWRLDPMLDLQRLPDNAALARALTVEVVWRQLVA